MELLCIFFTVHNVQPGVNLEKINLMSSYLTMSYPLFLFPCTGEFHMVIVTVLSGKFDFMASMLVGNSHNYWLILSMYDNILVIGVVCMYWQTSYEKCLVRKQLNMLSSRNYQNRMKLCCINTVCKWTIYSILSNEKRYLGGFDAYDINVPV